jgi:Asp-tRNA(Asn)/Glu-tRNA(Gln) amidotransferase A subunit family amidase
MLVPVSFHLLSQMHAYDAVFIVKTTVAQAVMQLESDSFLGPVVNPYNRSLTAGGSTGGEGALLGGRGSVIG